MHSIIIIIIIIIIIPCIVLRTVIELFTLYLITYIKRTVRCCVVGLECLSVGALSELTDELQRCVHEYSEELVSELARRDELDFEKELKNQFIWLLLRVQRRRRHLQQVEARAAVTGLVEKSTAANAEVAVDRS